MVHGAAHDVVQQSHGVGTKNSVAAALLSLSSVVGCSSSGPESMPIVAPVGFPPPPPPAAPDRPPAHVVFAAPDGSGTDCSLQAPCSLSGAQQKVRTVNMQMQGDIWVYLRGGRYALETPLALGPDDSGFGDFYVMYRAYAGETPVISGGRVIGGWTQLAGTAVWQSSSIDYTDTRQIYVAGKRATRAREAASVLGALTRTPDGYEATSRVPQTWRNQDSVELVYTGFPDAGSAWTESRCGVSFISDTGSGSAIHMKEPCWTNATVNKEAEQTLHMPSAVENARELMNRPGDWYYDKPSSTFYYMPLQGEDLGRIEVIAPVLEVLVSGNGAGGRPVRNIHFTGITFAHAAWLRPSGPDGFVEVQANVALVGEPPSEQSLPAAVSFRNGQNIRFERNTFVHLGAAGLVIDGGSQGNVVIGNVFTDISGSALRIGDVTTPNAPGALQDRRNWVIDNYVHDIAVEYRGGVGIMAGYVAETMIAHNEVANVPYTGISLGWGWGTDSYAESNEISYNHVHGHMLLLSDGGGVYVVSRQGSEGSNWSSVHHNYVQDQRNNFGALYFDQGSAYLDVHHNLVVSAPYWTWTNIVHDLIIHDNFSDTGAFRDDGVRLRFENNSLGPAAAGQAQSIVDAAGLEAAYRDIKGAPSN